MNSYFLLIVLLLQGKRDVAAVNLAYKKTAWQKDIYPGYEELSADLAVDGNTDTNGYNCSNTNASDNPWWIVDLGSLYTISTLFLYNRKETCNAYRLQNFTVETAIIAPTNNNFSHFKLCFYHEEPVSADNKEEIRCYTPMVARFIKVQIYLPNNYLQAGLVPDCPADHTVLNLCEVEVFRTYQPRTGRLFAKMDKVRVTGTRLTTMDVLADGQCGILCDSTPECTSFNVGERRGNWSTCEILNESDQTNRQSSGQPLPDNEWYHYC